MLTIKSIQEEGTDLDNIRQLFRKYENELNEDLCFQSFEAELKDPLKKYGPPHGTLLLAFWNNSIAGCIALAPLFGSGSCEMKRLYVIPEFRKNKIGVALVENLIEFATKKGYHVMKLDTLKRLNPAIRLYHTAGFFVTQPYNVNPIRDVVYMEKKL